MATFGQTTDNSAAQTYSSDRKLVSKFAPSTSGTVTNGHARMYAGAPVNIPTRFVIYSDNAGEPDALLATSDETVWNSTVEGVRNFTFSGANQIAITASTNYWIGVHYDYTTASVTVSRFTTAGLVRSNNDTYSDGAASPFGATATTAGPIDVYVTYTEGSSTTGQMKVYNGTSFVAKPVKVWNGSAWVTKPVKRWNGSSWVVTPY